MINPGVDAYLDCWRKLHEGFGLHGGPSSPLSMFHMWPLKEHNNLHFLYTRDIHTSSENLRYWLPGHDLELLITSH